MTRIELLAIAKPTLFNTEMVGALLDGRKTATRRVVKPKNSKSELVIDIGALMNKETISRGIHRFTSPKTPYQVGDYLYVRETWRMQNYGYHADTDTYDGQELEYRADLSDIENEMYGRRGGCAPCQWHPSLHMPKEAARIFLRVTDVRVERLQDITTLDILHEGIVDKECDKCREETGGCYPQKDVDVFCGREEILSDKYADLWESTIKKSDLDRYGWDANPWVWVIEFERVIMQ